MTALFDALPWWVRRRWYYLFPSFCSRFVPDPDGGIANVYCRACGYDVDVHRG